MRTRADAFRNIPKFRAITATATVAQCIATVLLAVALLLLAHVVDRVFLAQATPTALVVPLVGLALCVTARALALGISEWCWRGASSTARTVLRNELLARVAQRSAASWTPPGETASLLTETVEQLDAYITRYLPARIAVVTTPIIAAIAIGFIDPIVLLILGFTGPMLVLLLVLIGKHTQRLADQRLKELQWLHAFFLDMVAGLATLRAFGRTTDAAQSIASASARHANASLDVLRTAFQSSLVMEWAATAATALTAVVVSLQLVERDLAFAAALGALMLTPEFFLPFRRLAAEYHAGRTGISALHHITEWNRARDTVPASARSGALPRTSPEVIVDHVTYRHPDAAHAVLTGCSLTLPAGQTTALVGHSGCGKTTLTRLLLGFIVPESGRITIDGIELTQIDPELWHTNIAWIPQQPALVMGTIADNVRLGAPHESSDAVWAALDAAGAAKFVTRLPNGIDTPIGEYGLRLSGGQRQRLALARAYLRDAPFLIIDEGTAHLDPQTERAIAIRAQSILSGRTVLLVTHRDLARDLADQVIALPDTQHAEVPA
ncbi:MAG: thiol reductant ABC exporter subunit CydD [Acidimicrobiia bacterium]